MDMATGTEGQGTAATQPSAQTQTSGAAPEGFVEKARLDGALRKIEELTLANKALTERLNGVTNEKATLMADLGQKETAWTAQQSEFTKKLESASTEQTKLQGELAKFQAMQLKMKVINELNAPQLYSVIDVIPDSSDEATLKAAVAKLASFAGSIAQNREKELTAGITTIVTNPQQQATLPTTEAGWEQYVNSLPFGSPEYTKAMEQWHSQLFQPK